MIEATMYMTNNHFKALKSSMSLTNNHFSTIL